MNNRSLIILALITAVLGGFWFFHDYKGGEAKEAKETKEARLFPLLEEDEILSFTWKQDKITRQFKREGKFWNILMPPELVLRANTDAINTAAKNLAELKRVSVISENPTKEALKEFGLDKTTLSITVTHTSDYAQDAILTPGEKPEKITVDPKEIDPEKPFVLEVGSLTPDGSAYYMRQDNKGPVVEVEAGLVSQLAGELDTLREKSFLPVNPADVESISMSGSKGDFTLTALDAPKSSDVKDDDDDDDSSEDGVMTATSVKWSVSGNDLPKAFVKKTKHGQIAQADSEKVNEFLWVLRTLQVDRFLHPEEISKLGSVTTRVEIKSYLSDKPFVLEIGQKEGEGDKYYVHRSEPGEMMLFTLPQGPMGILDKTASSFLDHHVVSFASDDVNKIELSLTDKDNKDSNIIELKARRIRDGWELEKPSNAVKDEETRSNAIMDVIYDIADIKWEQSLPGDAPKTVDGKYAQVSLFDKEGKLIDTMFVAEPLPSGDTYVMRSSDNAVFLLDEDPTKDWRTSYRKLEVKEKSEKNQPEK